MALDQIPTETLLEIAERLKKASERITTGAKRAQGAGLEKLLLHFSTLETKYLPYVTDWAIDVEKEGEKQSESHERGLKSQAQENKDRHALYQKGKKPQKK